MYNTLHITSIHTDEARPWAEYSAMQFHELFQKYYFRWPRAYNKNNAPDTVELKTGLYFLKNCTLYTRIFLKLSTNTKVDELLRNVHFSKKC